MKLPLLCLSICFTSLLQAQETPPIEAVTANRALWPREVTISVAHQVPLVLNGKPAGTMQVAAGRVYPVKSVDSTGVQIDAMGSPMTFPIADTDLLTRVGEVNARIKAAAAAPAATTPAVAAATPARPAAAAPEPKVSNTVAKGLLNDLVSLDGKKLAPFDATPLTTKKYLAVYFSAAWCPPCRKFTPELVSWYKRKKGDLDKFDIIFVSSDKTEEDMLGYMTEDKMAWPALGFDKKKQSQLRSYSGRGIPCLVILDATGKVISHSYVDGEYVGPTKVLKDLDNLLKKES